MEGVKIKIADYERLETAILGAFKANIVTERQRWQCFHSACRQDIGVYSRLYSYLNDDNIDTVLRKIFMR